MNGIFTYSLLTGSVLCAVTGAFVLSRGLRSVVNISFFAGMVVLSFIQYAEFMSFRAEAPLYWLRAAMTGEMLLAVPWLVFSLTFARSNSKEGLERYRWVTAGLAAGFLVLAGLMLSGSTAFISVGRGRLLPIDTAGYVFYILLFLSLILILINLEHTLRASSGVSRWRIKYLLIGVGAVTAFYVFYVSHILLYRVMDPALLPVKGVVVTISVLLMAFSMLRSRLMDINVTVSRYMVYNSVTLVAVGAYLLVVGMVGEGIKHFGGGLNRSAYILFVFIALLVLAAFFLSDKIRRRLRVAIDKHFYRDRYDYRTQWLSLTHRLGSMKTEGDLHRAILEAAIDTIGSKNATMWLYDGEKKVFRPVDTVGVTLKDGYIMSAGDELLGLLDKKEWIVNLKELGAGGEDRYIGEKNAAILGEMRAALLVPLKSADEFLGIIVLGERVIGDVYNYEDYDILKTIGRQSAAHMLNLRQAEELARSREMAAFNRVSSFIMHDLKNLTHTLSLVAQNAAANMDDPEFREDAIQTINSTVAKMKNLMTRLSSMPRDAGAQGIKKQECDLNAIVEDTLKGLSVNGRRSVTVRKELGELPPVVLDPDEIQKVVHNILANAYDVVDTNGGEIMVATGASNGCVEVSIADNGPGMSMEFIAGSLFRPFKTTKKKGIGIGLYQCKTIVEAHNGRIDVESEEGRGTKFTVVLPREADGP